jgi:hypothetical protein
MEEDIIYNRKNCHWCGKRATRKVDGKDMATIWCNIECQNKWIDSFKEVDAPMLSDNVI